MDSYDYISPHSGDFINKINDDISDDYFDINREESLENDFKAKMKGELTPMKKSSKPMKIKKEVLTPVPLPGDDVTAQSPPNIFDIHVKLEKITPVPLTEVERKHRKRSMSVNAIMETIKGQDPTDEICYSMEHTHLSSACDDQTNSHFKWKSVQYCTKISKASSQSNLHSTSKFISMAEAIYHLQKDTPKRFHSSSRKQEMRAMDALANRKKVQLLRTTQPQSPALIAKTRIRPITALSQKEIEDLELQEIRKHPIKAYPISKAVLQGNFNLGPVQRRPKTQPEPFNLTQVKKKVFLEQKISPFVARPCPKYILEKPIEIARKPIPCTVPKTPNLSSYKYRSLENISKDIPDNISQSKCPFKVADKLQGLIPNQSADGHCGVPLSQKATVGPRRPQPFSFEQKDKERQLKKMEKIQQIYMEEKKLREFHANPIPSIVLKNSKVTSKYDKKAEFKKENKENVLDKAHYVFKARIPTVLSKEPFHPALKERPILEPLQIQLTTEVRARERDAYNQKIKAKEEYNEDLRKKLWEERQQKEEEEKAAMRAGLVHKAAPVRHYAPVVIQPSSVPLTRPESPNFALHKSS